MVFAACKDKKIPPIWRDFSWSSLFVDKLFLDYLFHAAFAVLVGDVEEIDSGGLTAEIHLKQVPNILDGGNVLSDSVMDVYLF